MPRMPLTAPVLFSAAALSAAPQKFQTHGAAPVGPALRCSLVTDLLWICSLLAPRSGPASAAPWGRNFCGAALSLAVAACAAQPGAQDILNAAGLKGGLVVHLGCGDGKLTAALRANESFLVQGLETDPARVEEARAAVRKAGLYGPVSVAHWADPSVLPYAENMVNLLVVEEGVFKGTREELLRVLVPLGKAVVLNSRSPHPPLTKPWPAEIDEWTHWLHDAGNGSVARDALVGPPMRMQWVVEPLWSRGHEVPSSVGGAVTARGRLFYALDEGQTGVYTLPARWALIARDAFNGVLLWRRPLPGWGPDLSFGGFGNGFRPRRLVTDGACVYLPLGDEAVLTAIDAATGASIHEFKEAAGATDILCEDGLLLVSLQSAPGDGKRAAAEVLALETGSWKTRWRIPAGGMASQTLALGTGRVVYRAGVHIVGLDANDGREAWRTPLEKAEAAQKGLRSSSDALVLHGKTVLLLTGGRLSAFSAETGRVLWARENAPSTKGELFVIGNEVWRNHGDNLIAHDLATGRETRTIDAARVFSKGHHPRCYRYKATERYVIANNRGAEFIGVSSDEQVQNDWLRGNCGHGAMPANGLLYAPPCQCFCYGGAMLTGFKALAAGPVPDVPAGSFADSARLKRGLAYDEVQRMAPVPAGEDDWPMYRRNPDRSGAAAKTIAPDVRISWQRSLGGVPTPPVVANGLVLVAVKDAHTVHALDAGEGKAVWQFTADARIDSPPTYHDGLVFFGCADGQAYALRASDGRPVWRFHAAPRERWIGAFGQVESAWPVHGSVVVLKGVVYLSAGRSTYLDGGIHVYGLDPRSGRVLHHACLKDAAVAPGDETAGDGKKPYVPAFHVEGARSDLLVSDGEFLYMGPLKLSAKLERLPTPYLEPGEAKTTIAELAGQPYVNPALLEQELHKSRNLPDFPSLGVVRGPMGDKRMGLRLLATGGFLDDTWFNRTYWMYASIWPGFYIAHLSPKAGQLLSFDAKTTYGVQAFTSRTIHSPTLEPGTKGYLLFADDNGNEPILDDRTRNRDKGMGYARGLPPKWHRWVPLRIRAMAVAGETLFVAGTPDAMPRDDPYAAIEGRLGARWWAVSALDGTRRAEADLGSEPVFDGLIAAGERIYVSLRSGQVCCLSSK